MEQTYTPEELAIIERNKNNPWLENPWDYVMDCPKCERENHSHHKDN